MRTKSMTVAIPEETHKTLRLWCVDQEQSVSALVRELIEAYFAEHDVRKKVKRASPKYDVRARAARQLDVAEQQMRQKLGGRSQRR